MPELNYKTRFYIALAVLIGGVAVFSLFIVRFIMLIL